MAKQKNAKKKTWNFHLIIPASALAVVWLVFFSLDMSERRFSERSEASQITRALAYDTAENEKQDYQSEAISIAEIDENVLNGIKDLDYAEVKEKLNVTGDFCLAVVDGQNSILLEKHPNGKKQTELCDGMV